ncbi:MAG: C39 family peptidase [Actinobacteria bacterium]|nr:C39 family peptidase [Actinomycetota bacterium]
MQTTSYNCGPATLVSIARSYGSTLTQSQAAADLGTTTAGTDWSNSTGSPMKNQLNRYSSPFTYVTVSLPYTPTTTDKTNFRNRLMSNINSGHAIAGDAVEMYNGPHLIGHPNRPATSYHWFAIEGYGDGGASTHYADSVAGASSISWSSSVAPYNWISSDSVTTIMGARGYIW